MKNDNRSYISTWKAPSNLAIVKYWGKKGFQEPVNPSLSFSLSASFSQTRIQALEAEDPGIDFQLNGQEVPPFLSRIQSFKKTIENHLPFTRNYHLKIRSENTFPHSSGIASSASAMSSIALCLADLQQQIALSRHIDIQEVSSLARQGSGSASRSVLGGWNLWGRTPAIPESSDHYAIHLEVADVFQNYHDDILIVDSSPKPVSSSQGHALMDHHPYREGRITQARENTIQLLKHLQSGDMEKFTEITESEALSLHSLMMSSSPGYTLMQPATLKIIREVRQFRNKTGIPVAFSMDAGPNIHLLYPDADTLAVRSWQETHIKPYLENEKIIHDLVGQGPEKIIASRDQSQ